MSVKVNHRSGRGAEARQRLRWLQTLRVISGSLLLTAAIAAPASGQPPDPSGLCDNAFEDCRARILQMIEQEQVGLDVAFWFMTDTQVPWAIIGRFKAGVPVRILLDVRADNNYPSNASVRKLLIDAKIPIRYKTTEGSFTGR